MSRSTQHATRNTQRILRVLLPVFGLLALSGYFGPWVDHKAAGLAILGLDLGEYVKFLPAVRSGEIGLWREGFYLPLVAVSLAFSLYAFRTELGYPWYVRAGLLAVAVMAALNLLPPAWTPQRMLTPEFQQQSWGIVICLAASGVQSAAGLVAALGKRHHRHSVSAWLQPACLSGSFSRYCRALAELYNQPLAPGWGLWVMAVGLIGVASVATFGRVWTGTVRKHHRYSIGKNSMLLGAMNNPRVNIFDEIKRIDEGGFDFIDLTIEAPAAAPETTDWPAVGTAVAETGLGIVAHAAPYLPLDNPSPLVRQAALDELRRTIDVAQQLGAPFCTTHFVGWPSFPG